MSEQDIASAIEAHVQWKVRLKTAIDTGKLDTTVETTRADDQCKFGKWLKGTSIPAAAKQTPEYREVVKLHAEFHRVAASIIEHVIAGRKDEAQRALGFDGSFATASRALVSKLESWQKTKP